jgi:hypothetical protein
MNDIKEGGFFWGIKGKFGRLFRKLSKTGHILAYQKALFPSIPCPARLKELKRLVIRWSGAGRKQVALGFSRRVRLAHPTWLTSTS